MELWMFTALELIRNSGQYAERYPVFANYCCITATVTDCVAGGYSSTYTMAALATVIGRPVASVYPPVNGPCDTAFRQLTTTIQPLRQTTWSEPLYILWSRIGGYNAEQMWSPDHFVPLLLVSSEEVQVPVDVGDIEHFSCSTTDENIDDKHTYTPDVCHSPIASNNAEFMQPRETTTPSQESGVEDLVPTEHPIPSHEQSSSSLPGRFMDGHHVIEVILSEAPVVTVVPKGRKENVFFVVDNTNNAGNRTSNKYSNFAEDCGIWDSTKSSTKKHGFITTNDGMVQFVEKHEGLYYTNWKKPETVIQPQPAEVHVLKRYYATLKRDSTYKKRIAWIENPPAQYTTKSNRAVIEHIGTFPDDTSSHGNCKHANGDYIRTQPDVFEKISQQVSVKPPRKVYTDMLLESSDMCLHDVKQVQNVKQQMLRKQHPDQHRQNSADQLQTLISRMQNEAFVQHLVTLKGKTPAFVLYTNEQLTEVVKYCSADARTQLVLGVDCTFNLGECYVTCIVYKNGQLLRKTTQEPPLMLGPVYLH